MLESNLRHMEVRYEVEKSARLQLKNNLDQTETKSKEFFFTLRELSNFSRRSVSFLMVFIRNKFSDVRIKFFSFFDLKSKYISNFPSSV